MQSNHDSLFGLSLNVVSAQHSEYYKFKMNVAKVSQWFLYHSW